MKFGWKKTLLYSLIPALVLFVLFESAARLIEIWVPPWQVDYGWGFDAGSRLFVPSPDDPGTLITNPPKEVSFRKQQFAMPKPPGTFRIFMLGGSNVNVLYSNLLTFAEELTQECGGHPRVEIVNAGGNAYGTHRLVPILLEVLGYEPDLILFYEANNEFEEVEQLELVDLRKLALQRFIYKSALCRFIRDRIASVQVSQMQKEHNQRILANPMADFKSGASHTYTTQEISERMAAFRSNLAFMITTCQTRGVPFILGTVPSNLWKPDLHDDGVKQQAQALYDRGEYEKGCALVREALKHSGRHQSSDTENAILRDLANECHVPLADVETAITDAEPHHVPGETLFTDRCHMHLNGYLILLRVFKDPILKIVNGT